DRHQPSGGRAIHPGADIGDNGSDPKHRKCAMAERRKRRPAILVFFRSSTWHENVQPASSTLWLAFVRESSLPTRSFSPPSSCNRARPITPRDLCSTGGLRDSEPGYGRSKRRMSAASSRELIVRSLSCSTRTPSPELAAWPLTATSPRTTWIHPRRP